MNLIRTRQDVLKEIYEQTKALGNLFPAKSVEPATPAASATSAEPVKSAESLTPVDPSGVREEVVYRKNSKAIDKVIQFDADTGLKIKTTHYDYFNSEKVRSVDEFDIETGKKVRTINYVLYKSIDEYDFQTGKKVRTINYNVKDDTKISSIQEYDLETGKIVTVSIFKRDGKTVSITKKINPEDGTVMSYIHKNAETVELEHKNIQTRSYDNILDKGESNTDHVANLIDDLYSSKNTEFSNLI